MTIAALVELASDTPRVYRIPPAGGAIGRSPAAGICVDDETVSRMQAALRWARGLFVIENRSTTTVTRVDGTPLTGPAPLADGVPVELGRVRLRFHDLSSGERPSGPRCSHCERENLPGARACWHCAAPLDRGPAGVVARRPVVCRLVSRDERTYDLPPHVTARIDAGGGVTVSPGGDATAGAQIRTDEHWASLAVPGVALTVNGERAAVGQRFRTGDLLSVGDASFVVIARGAG